MRGQDNEIGTEISSRIETLGGETTNYVAYMLEPDSTGMPGISLLLGNPAGPIVCFCPTCFCGFYARD